MKIRICDKSFRPNPSCGTGSTGIRPNKIEWVNQETDNGITVYTDMCFQQVDIIQSKIKVAWLIEPKSIAPQNYNWMQNNWQKFDYVLTHNLDMLKIDSRFKYTIFGGHWIKEKAVYPKTKDLSIIASAKRMVEGHRLRHAIVDRFGAYMDTYGRGYKYVEDKLEGLKDYRFQVVIENERTPGFFTEKIIDAVVTGTIPIYWGCPNISDFFNMDGILTFSNINDFEKVLSSVNKEYYESKLKAITENYFIALEKYLTPEDYQFKNFFKELI